MRLPVDPLIDWLDARVPDWYGFVVGFFTGAVGVFALSFLEAAIFGVQSLYFFMPFIVLFAGASAGFKFWEKSKSRSVRHKKVTAGAAGLAVGAFACALQLYVDKKFFETTTPFAVIFIVTVAGPPGGLAGGWLRRRSEEIKGSQG